MNFTKNRISTHAGSKTSLNVALILARVGKSIVLVHLSQTNLLVPVLVIDTLPLVVAPLDAVTTKTLALVTEETIYVTLFTPPYENDNILHKTGWKEDDVTITDVTPIFEGEEE